MRREDRVKCSFYRIIFIRIIEFFELLLVTFNPFWYARNLEVYLLCFEIVVKNLILFNRIQISYGKLFRLF